MAEHLCRTAQPQLIVDVRGAATKLVRFRQLFPFLAVDGLYVLELGPDDASPTDGWTEALAATVADVRFCDGLALVRKGAEQRIKLREAWATEILTARYGDAWGSVIATRPPLHFTPRVEVRTHGDRGLWWGQRRHAAAPDRIDVPQLTLRRYTHAACWQEQRAALDNYWLPDTFRHPGDLHLWHRRLTPGGGWHARLRDGDPRQPTRQVDGPLFYFDTEFPGHYGHVLTEVISRHWGWQQALAIEPDLRPLIGMNRGGGRIPRFQRDLFAALGIDADTIEYIAPDEAITVSDLYAATPMLSMPAYVSSDLQEHWAAIRSAVFRPDLDTPELLFVGRRPKPIRTCLNSDEVERYVKSVGFEIWYPEDHAFAEQVTAFANAKVIAGFAGSNMFTAMFAPGATVLSITADTYTATTSSSSPPSSAGSCTR